jgi:aromatic ring-opening dioxygenase LigB subunit
MSIVFSCIVPHSPFLIPAIGKENLERLKATQNAYKKLEENLYSSKAETIVIISPHGHTLSDSFSMNLSPEFSGNFEEFGDFSTKINLSGDVGLAHKIRENLETKAPLQLMSEPNLDYGSSIPLYLLTEHLPNIKIIPIYYSGLDMETHFNFGHLLKREFIYNQQRVAVVASGDLSHKLTKDAPAGYSAKAQKFDKKIIDLLLKRKNQDLVNIKKSLLEEVAECGLKSIVMLAGVLDDMKYAPELLSYEAPFGVGYLTMNFKL